MSNLQEACEKLQAYLDNWYAAEKKKYFESDSKYSFGVGMWYAKNDFFLEHPEYAEFDFSIFTSFIPVEGTFKAGCFCGDCEPWDRLKVSGIKVTPVDWVRLTELSKPRNKFSMEQASA